MSVLVAGVGASGLFLLALVFLRLARRMRDGTLPRNGFVGIRTAATTHSEAAWSAGHHAAEPLTRVIAYVAVVAAVVTVALALLLRLAGVADSVAVIPTLVALGVGCGTVFALNGWAAVVASRAARGHHTSGGRDG
ncbi:SdpI family protein [Halostreptopolyspora alba]|uniref:SdpI family protein n=1 Tax=Halostreptopolyspora alba TaxID=2487137 RepID=A0A3N0EGD6_9ACTN|nr:SdpI family protein [Nocardiopsaceae bacterium YIM 96095]